MSDEPKSGPRDALTGGRPGEIDPEATPSAEEIAASRRLRDALEDPSLRSDGADLARSLRAAWSPEAMSEDALESTVEASLSGGEVAAAEGLRDALDGEAGVPSTPEAELARALACAHDPQPLSDAEHRAIVARALGEDVVVLRRRSTVVRVAFGAAGVLALAASVLLVVRGARPPGADEAPLARARTTQPLFTEPFRSGDASARIDRIAVARAADYRENRFAKWGVR